MSNSELVFIPVPGIGHLVSTIEFAKRLIDRHEHLSVTILYIKFEFSQQADAYTKSLVDSQARIKLTDLPQVTPPPLDFMKSPEQYLYVAVESVAPHVSNALRDMVSSSKTKVVGVFLDFFCAHLSELASELGLPSYLFMASSLGVLSLTLHLPTPHDPTGSDLTLPGFANPVPVSTLPSSAFPKDVGHAAMVKLARRFREMKGIVVNSFAELEPYSLDSLIGDGRMPPIYMVGPVVSLESGKRHPSSDKDQNDKIVEWLDDQPRSSVVFLCFGSVGKFGVTQLREIASGLERSGHRFLWSVRVPETNTMEEILPEGFLERVERRGMICNDWVPQAEVLAHGAVGGFVSHCGWNSILESLWFGVPIAAWPMYAEQQLNAFRMVKEFELAVEMSLDYRSGAEDVVVSADEIESAVRQLMEGESKLRKDVKEMSEMARKAVDEGGYSYTEIGRLINDFIGTN